MDGVGLAFDFGLGAISQDLGVDVKTVVTLYRCHRYRYVSRNSYFVSCILYIVYCISYK
jgi:hypothetical protein